MSTTEPSATRHPSGPLTRSPSTPTWRDDPDLTDQRGWLEALQLAAALGLPFGVIPAALLLEFAPQLGFFRPGLWSFGGTFVVFAALARARHRGVVWAVAAGVSGLLILGAVLATAWTLTQSIPGTA
jgi:hypothetical protein